MCSLEDTSCKPPCLVVGLTVMNLYRFQNCSYFKGAAGCANFSVLKTMGSCSGLNTPIVCASVCDGCPLVQQCLRLVIAVKQTGSVGSAIWKDVLQDTSWADVTLSSLPVSYGCFGIVVAPSLLIFLPGLSAFRISSQRQPSEALKYCRNV